MKTLTDILISTYTVNRDNKIQLDNKTLILSIDNTFGSDYRPLDCYVNFIDAITQTLEFSELFYIDWMNNYFTVDAMLDDYNLDITSANKYLELGRLYNHNHNK